MEIETAAERILGLWQTARELTPLVHMIPNTVTAALCADAIAAVGGRPLMADAPEEMEEITASADGLAINLGQPSQEKRRACLLAAATAAGERIPAVFDPVGAGASKYRRTAAEEILAVGWSGIVKGNRSELNTVLTGELTHEGVDSLGEYRLDQAAKDFLCRAAAQGRTLVLAATGREDEVFWLNGPDGPVWRFALVHPSARPVSLVGTGCVAGALCGVLLAAERRSLRRELTAEEFALASAGAVSLVALAGEMAGGRARAVGAAGDDTVSVGAASGEAPTAGYGTFRWRFLDALGTWRPDDLREYLIAHGKIEEG